MYDAPHGAICGRLLPFLMQANVAALISREPRTLVSALRRDCLDPHRDFEATAQDGVGGSASYARQWRFRVWRLWGGREQFAEIIEKTQRSAV